MIAWKENHKDDCKLNHNGSAPAMEGAGAKTFFRTCCPLQYYEYYGDGDSKAFRRRKHMGTKK